MFNICLHSTQYLLFIFIDFIIDCNIWYVGSHLIKVLISVSLLSGEFSCHVQH